MTSKPTKSSVTSSVMVANDIIEPPSYEAATESGLPHANEITAHLKLLFTFHKLRERVTNDSSCSGIRDDWLPVDGSQHNDDFRQIHMLIAEKRWAVFVQKAALRFELWWKALQTQSHGTPIRVGNLLKGPFTIDQFSRSSKPLVTSDRLPPLDVLMVWHSFILSPRKYLEDCLLQGMMGLWSTSFPWAEIDRAIDTETGEFNPGPASIWEFEAIAPWSNAADHGLRILSCPHCGTGRVQCPVTNFDKYIDRAENRYKALPNEGHALLRELREQLQKSTGWGDPGFRRSCASCYGAITADTLCASKFITHVKSYASAYRSDLRRSSCVHHLENQVPMPGTVLDPGSGRPPTGPASAKTEFLLSNRLFLLLLADTVSRIDPLGQAKEPDWVYSMAEVRKLLGSLLDCSEQMKYLTEKTQRRANKQQRGHVRRMMSYYNDNPWMFSFDLASAVHRQSVFVEKMVHIDWLHSPALSSTARRVIAKYQRFVTVMSNHPSDMAVPTLDVDLAWHTQQLTPSQYYKYTITRTGRFVDHDDKVSEHKLSDSFAKTSKHYQRMFQEPYSECSCWYCEAMHASISRYGTHFLPGSTKTYRRPKNVHPVNDGTATAHISAHNVVHLEDPTSKYKQKMLDHMRWLDKAYERACDRAKKDKRPPPMRRHPPTVVEHDIIKKQYGPAAAAVGAVVLVAGASAVYWSVDGTGIDFGGTPECINTQRDGGGGCVAGTCGGGVGWGGFANDDGGLTGACGGGGGSCGDGGGDGGGCGGCGGCGG